MADLTSLAALVAQAKQTVAAKSAATTAATKLKSARSAVERESLQTEVNDMLAIVDWRSTALVLVYDHWECACGNHGKSPQGMFFFQEHTRLANATRIVPPRSESEGNDLPKRIKLEHRVVAVCPECAGEAGFHKIIEPPKTPEERRMALRSPGEMIREWQALRTQREEEQP